MTLRAVLDGHGLGELTDTAELLVCELVTNAYRYSDGHATLRLRRMEGKRLRIGVWDTNPVIPAPFDRPPGTLAPLPPRRRMPAPLTAGVGSFSCRAAPTTGAAICSATICSAGAASCSGASSCRDRSSFARPERALLGAIKVGLKGSWWPLPDAVVSCDFWAPGWTRSPPLPAAAPDRRW
ncbi:ATP-binding protein [Streptomyces sp. M10(2022)]